MYARVKESHDQKMVVACGGIFFVKGDWRPVPAHEEASAKALPFLETTDKVPPASKKSQFVVETPRTASNADKTVRLVSKRQGFQEPVVQAEAPKGE
jgi:hypothetical protein